MGGRNSSDPIIEIFPDIDQANSFLRLNPSIFIRINAKHFTPTRICYVRGKQTRKLRQINEPHISKN